MPVDLQKACIPQPACKVGDIEGSFQEQHRQLDTFVVSFMGRAGKITSISL
jgi:hypothetical protein